MTRTLTRSASHGRRGRPPVATEPGPWPLAITLTVGVALGAALWRLAGPPSMPRGLPDATAFRTALTASEVSDADLIAVATAVAWLALGYLALTVALRALAVSAERATRGARWARVALRLSHLITVPAVRRVVDGGVAGTLLFSSWMPLAPRVAAAAEPTTVIALHAMPAADVAPSAPGQPVVQAEPARFIAYTVARGDDLWDIARRMYGDGSRYVELFDANRDRVMPGGERFSDPRLIRVGWVLHVPLPAPGVTVAGDAVSYRVARGDHLWGIAARLLGDGFRWTEIWEANRERTMDNGRQFTDPNRIYPGWGLVVPADVIGREPTAAAPPKPVTPGPSATPHLVPPAGVEETAAPDVAAPESVAGQENEAAEAGDGGIAWDWPSPPRPLAITVGGFVVLGAAALFVHRLAQTGRWPGLHFPQRGAGRTGDAGRVVLITRALTAAIAAEGFPEARVLRADESARELRCAITCPAGDADRLAVASDELRMRLGCSVAAEVVDASHVELTLRGAGTAAMALGDASPTAAALIVPVGSDAAGGIVYLNLAAVGSVVVGGADGERRRLLHDWLAALSTTAGADELAFRADTSATVSLGEDAALPHFGGAAPGGDVEDLVDELEDLIQSRAEEPAPRPLIALVDVAVPAGLAAADRLLRSGPTAGVYVVALALDGDGAGDARFGARVMLGVDAADGATPDDTARPVDRGSVVLRIAGDDSVSLEPVLVRRDTSRRWLEGASLPGVNGFGPRADTTDGHDPPTGGGGHDSAPAAEPPAEVFDWRRAIFDHPKVTSPEPDAPAPEPRDPPGDHEEESDAQPAPAAIPTASDPMPKAAPAQDTGVPAEPEATLADGDPVVGRSAEGTAAGPSNGSADLSEAEKPVDDRRATATAPDGAAPTVLSPPPPMNEQVAIMARDLLPTPTRQEALLFTDDPVEAPSEPEVAVATTPVLVHCLGRLRVLVDGAEVTAWPYDKGRELLALLVARGGAAMSRQEAADALWPNLPWDASVKHMMSNAATALRAALRTAAGRNDLQPVTLTAGRYVLQPGVVRSDLDLFDLALRRAASLPYGEALHYYERALAIYEGDFLEAEPFAWLETYQVEYRRRYLAGARRAGEIAIERGDLERARRFFRAAVERLPTDEEAARGLMRCCAAAGDRNAVRKTYHTLAAALQETLDAPDAGPSAETRALLTELTAEAAVG